MPITLADLVQPATCAVVTQELQGAVVGAASPLAELARAAQPILEPVAQLCDAARKRSVPVIHGLAVRRADGLGANSNGRLFAMMKRSGVAMQPGTSGAEPVPEIRPHPDDLRLPRLHGLSPFHGTELDWVLRNQGITTIIGVGVSLNVAMTNFAFDAVNSGYQFVMPTDAVAGFPAEYAQMVLTHTLGAIATLTTVADVLASWGA